MTSMAFQNQAVIVMGVSGTGKSTIATGLAHHFDGVFIEGDSLHQDDNIAAMKRGEPLTDEMRAPWLKRVGQAMADALATQAPKPVFATCSALKRSYRDLIRSQLPEVQFLHLHGDQDMIAARMSGRTEHFMPVSLLTSQFATLEPLESDEAHVVVDVTGTPDEVLKRAVSALEKA